MFEIRHYITGDGRDLYVEWRDKVKDRAAQIAIDRRIYRAELGNFGDHKHCRDGVWELRIDMGPGYRVYYAQACKTLVLLLFGGTKRSQVSDIPKAREYWKDWQRSNLKQEKKR